MKINKSCALLAVFISVNNVSDAFSGTILSGKSFISYRCSNSGQASGYKFQNINSNLFIVSQITNKGTANGLNALDVLFYTSSPITNTQNGLLYYSTNTALDIILGESKAVYGSAVDKVYEKKGNSSTQILIAYDEQAIAAFKDNYFRSTSNLYTVTSGGMILNLATDGQTAYGTITLNGTGLVPGSAQYLSNFTCSFTKSGSLT